MHFTYVTTHYPTLPWLYLRHSSFSNPSVASPMSQLIPQPFFRFSYATSSSLNSPGEPPMHFTYVTAHSPTVPWFYLRHSSFSNPSVPSPMSQALHVIHLTSRPCTWPRSHLILQPFRGFTYVTAHSPTLLSLLLHHRLFIYITWRAAHGEGKVLHYWAYPVKCIFLTTGDNNVFQVGARKKLNIT